MARFPLSFARGRFFPAIAANAIVEAECVLRLAAGAARGRMSYGGVLSCAATSLSLPRLQSVAYAE
jgi:hypothetical protein